MASACAYTVALTGATGHVIEARRNSRTARTG
jgi:hypothetical protein